MDRRFIARVSRVGICAGLFASACSSDTNLFDDMAAQQAAEAATFPGANWSVGDPAELGFDPAVLEEIAAEADPETSCLLVTRHGEIVGEWYWNGFTEEEQDVVMSVTQTYTSTLVGIAQDEGLLDIDDPVAEYVPEWAGTPSEDVTIRDILSHVTGRESTNSIGNTELYNGLLRAQDPGEFAIGLSQEHDRGTVWSQNMPALELLEPILRSATGMTPAEYAQEKLFAPIGAGHTNLGETGGGESWMHTFLRTTCRDAARFGYLFLRQGDWNGTQVVSEEWVEEATHPSQELNPGFGYMWWLNEPGSLVSIENILTPDYDEPSNLQLNPDAPLDMYWALGFGGRLVQVHPETDTVVVRLGGGDEAANMQQVSRLVTEALIE